LTYKEFLTQKTIKKSFGTEKKHTPQAGFVPKHEKDEGNCVPWREESVYVSIIV